MTAPHARTAHPGAGLRMLRAAVFAAVCVVLAACGHSLAACTGVPLWTLGAGFLGCLLVVVPLAGRARSLPGIAALLALGQTALHTLFGLGQHGATMASGGMAMGSMNATGTSGVTGSSLVEQATRLLCGSSATGLTPGHAFHLLLDAHLIDRAGRPVAGRGALAHAADITGSSAGLLPSLPMLLGHVLAAVAAGWLLRRGDLALLRLIELSAHGVAEGALVRSLRGALALASALCAGLLPAAEPARRGRRTDRNDVPAPHTTALQHTVIRRGPPATAFLLAA
ncbi:hypothetical protein ACH47Z_14980 [Streptomyces sp. NPDC020192]|uniref:hypothetical protein n=1 Tax=Streptomyces sp. NPDC020192 TaxID=3365066 RepID=UPI0037A2B3E9